VGNSAGAAIAGIIQMKSMLKKDDVVVVIFHDHGTRYLGKMFNDDWMRDRGFLESKKPKTAREIVAKHSHLPLVAAKVSDTVAEVYAKLEKFGISQLPVLDEQQQMVGSINDSHLYALWVKNPNIQQQVVKEIMQKPFPMVDEQATLEDISKLINKENNAVMVKAISGSVHIITKYDLISALSD
jgi:cystathionine beta-synthase